MIADAFAFALALHDPRVRAHLTRCGYVDGGTIHVDTEAPRDHEDGSCPADFLVWPDSSIPGGWDGCPVPAAP